MVGTFKDYAQTSENKLSSARTLYVNYIKCSEKIHKHSKKPKIDSIISCLPWGITTYLQDSQFWKAINKVLLEVEQKSSHRMAISYLSKEFNTILFWKFGLF